jgi:predicted GIY-YIG superfamily endonuclease
MAYFVYILRSRKDGSYYIGSTQDIDERLVRHKKQQDFLTAEASRFNSSLLLNLCLRSNTYGEAIAGDTKGAAERREI